MGKCARACVSRGITRAQRVCVRARVSCAHIPFMHELSRETRARTDPLSPRVIPRDTRARPYTLHTSFPTRHARAHIPFAHELSHETRTRARTYPLCTSYPTRHARAYTPFTHELSTRHARAHIPFTHELYHETLARTHTLYARVIPQVITRDTRAHTHPLRTSYPTRHARAHIPFTLELSHKL